MLQDTQTVRCYQRITDALVAQWNRGYRTDDLRLYLEGYLAALRHTEAIEPYLINQLEDESIRFLHDPSNFAMPESKFDYY